MKKLINIYILPCTFEMSLLWLPKWDLIYETLILPEIILMKNIYMRPRHVILLPVISCKGWSNFLLYLWSSLQKQPPEVFCTKGILRNFANFTGKHLCQSLFVNEVAGLRPATLLKKGSGKGVFLWNLRNFKEHLLCRTPLVAASESPYPAWIKMIHKVLKSV